MSQKPLKMFTAPVAVFHPGQFTCEFSSSGPVATANGHSIYSTGVVEAAHADGCLIYVVTVMPALDPKKDAWWQQYVAPINIFLTAPRPLGLENRFDQDERQRQPWIELFQRLGLDPPPPSSLGTKPGVLIICDLLDHHGIRRR